MIDEKHHPDDLDLNPQGRESSVVPGKEAEDIWASAAASALPDKLSLTPVTDVPIEQLSALEGYFLPAQSTSLSPGLVRANQNTVHVSTLDGEPMGSGVVVNYHGKKYFLTATHVLGETAFGSESNLQIVERGSEGFINRPLKDIPMLYSAPMAKEMGLSAGDVGVFEYNGSLESIELADLSETGNSFAIGYPGIHLETWKDTLEPTVSPGSSFIEQKKPIDEKLLKYFAKHGIETKSEPIPKAFFTGAISGGI